MPEETPSCIICGKPGRDGLTVCGCLICAECEQKIVTTKADDPAYSGLVRKLKQVWPLSEAR